MQFHEQLDDTGFMCLELQELLLLGAAAAARRAPGLRTPGAIAAD